MACTKVIHTHIHVIHTHIQNSLHTCLTNATPPPRPPTPTLPPVEYTHSCTQAIQQEDDDLELKNDAAAAAGGAQGIPRA